MQISYKHSDQAWTNYIAYLTELILRKKPQKICEIGGGANPCIALEFIRKHNIEYTVMDISSEQLAKAPDGYRKVLGDITSDNIEHLQNDYDFVFSLMLAEHIKDGEKFHANVHRILKPGGTAFHFFPTLYSLPFLANKYMPENFSYHLLKFLFQERDNQGKHGKFPAYYSWCYGPSKKNIARFKALGYEIDSFTGFFGHGYYQKIPPLHFLSRLITKLLLLFPISHLTSYGYVVLVRTV